MKRGAGRPAGNGNASNEFTAAKNGGRGQPRLWGRPGEPRCARQPIRRRTLPAGCKDIDRNAFAPFSHDGQTGTKRMEVAEPGALTLLGTGLLIRGFAGQRRWSEPPRG